MGYAELHCLTNFSFLRGASHPEELVERAAELGYAALAITDECSVAGVVRAHVAAREARAASSSSAASSGSTTACSSCCSRPIAAGYGAALPADHPGRRAAARALTDSRVTTWRPRPMQPPGDASRVLNDCLALWLPAATPCATNGRWLSSLFPERLWIAVELLTSGRTGAGSPRSRRSGDELGLPLAAAGDVHMHARGRRALQDVLTATRLGDHGRAGGLALFRTASVICGRSRASPSCIRRNCSTGPWRSPSAAVSRWRAALRISRASSCRRDETPTSYLRTAHRGGRAQQRWPRGAPAAGRAPSSSTSSS